MNSSLLIKRVPLGSVICFSSNVLCNINLYRYCDSVGVNVGICLACSIHCVSSGVGGGGNASSVLLRWVPLVLSENRVLVIHERVQS